MAIKFEDKGDDDAKPAKAAGVPKVQAEPLDDEPPADGVPPPKLPFAKSVRPDKKRKGR